MDALPAITCLSTNIIRILGQNPGKFTLQGTNTYLVGCQNPYILIDAGEGRDEYIPLLESVFRDLAKPTDPTQPDISDIIISHWHHDHIGGLPSLLSSLRKRWDERNTGLPYRPPRLHKFPLSTAELPTSQDTFYTLPSIAASLPRDLFTPALDASVFNDLRDGQCLSVPFIPPLHVLHTPGHTIDSLSIYLPSDRALYTADSVLGQGTAVFEDLTAYLSSLKKMLDYVKARDRSQSDSPIQLYPGHGPVIMNGIETLNAYIQHRLERESQILDVLKSAPPHDSDSAPAEWTTWKIVQRIYAAYPEALWVPAAKVIDLHLRKLERDGRVTKLGGEGREARWRLNVNNIL
ncbi:hypothetical protein APHAL10511_007128 [Amanita phalloides]|nr:hypothetical protein APHAL10511_007128 [Amanita phalloides]